MVLLKTLHEQGDDIRSIQIDFNVFQAICIYKKDNMKTT